MVICEWVISVSNYQARLMISNCCKSYSLRCLKLCNEKLWRLSFGNSQGIFILWFFVILIA